MSLKSEFFLLHFSDICSKCVLVSPLLEEKSLSTQFCGIEYTPFRLWMRRLEKFPPTCHVDLISRRSCNSLAFINKIYWLCTEIDL